MSKLTPVARLIEKLDLVSSSTDCWLYLGALAPNGYGIFNDGDEGSVLLHRYAYNLFYGPIPEGKVVMHKCNVKNCCNPKHLKAGTQKQNIAQCIREGRKPKTYKKRRPVTESELNEIRTRHAAGESAYKIGKSLNRSEPLLSAILSGKTHKPKPPKPIAPATQKQKQIAALEDFSTDLKTIINANRKPVAAEKVGQKKAA
ncbi:HNH endonuclease [Granulicella sp. dw_53]|uniref:HNH endonuclease n=1 Tax=Granulicella sp. dw_53 TaxID=2719792 RepID=UPI001BD66C34|nr:HNH endonuclease [Granulicella sp. dw_53]